jgi:adenylate cyclase
VPGLVAATETKVAILFADVVGSTRLYESLGDVRARETVQQCLAEMREATEQFGGAVIKTIGDEILATFPGADCALDAAHQMQQRITGNPAIADDGVHVAIRVGCHYGPVVADERDIYGSAVVTANRMTSQAKAGQVLTTAGMVEQLGPQWLGQVRQIDVATPRGQSDEVAVFEVLWQPEEATGMLPSLKLHTAPLPVTRQLSLRFGGQALVLAEGGLHTVTLGRADENDICVKGNLISRMHARIEFNKGRFLLVDESTNGTFVQHDGGQESYVRRDSAELNGSGIISMGRVAARGTALAIEYQVED